MESKHLEENVMITRHHYGFPRTLSAVENGKLCCALKSPGELLTPLMPKPHSIPITSESLGMGPRHQNFLKFPRWFQCTLKGENHCLTHTSALSGPTTLLYKLASPTRWWVLRGQSWFLISFWLAPSTIPGIWKVYKNWTGHKNKPSSVLGDWVTD